MWRLKSPVYLFIFLFVIVVVVASKHHNIIIYILFISWQPSLEVIQHGCLEGHHQMQ
jgi:hypothetical protein